MTDQTVYNYIIQFPQAYYGMVFGDAARCGNAAFMRSPGASIPERLVRGIAKIRRLPRPVHRLFFRFFLLQYGARIRRMQAAMADPEKPLCFIFYRTYLSLLADGLYAALHKYFPGSRIVILHTDRIGSDRKAREALLKDTGNRCADLFCTFDPQEAKAYRIPFHPLPMSDFSGRFLPAADEWDVLFVGRGKDRLSMLKDVWNHLTVRGLRCHFRLVGVPEEMRKEMPPGICFCDYIPYEDYLRMAAKSRILLEIIQGEASGSTLRVGEAVILGKKLLSNNLHLAGSGLYDPDNMYVFRVPEDIPDSFLSGKAAEYRRELKERLSLQSFLRSLEHDLNEMEQISSHEL